MVCSGGGRVGRAYPAGLKATDFEVELVAIFPEPNPRDGSLWGYIEDPRINERGDVAFKIRSSYWLWADGRRRAVSGAPLRRFKMGEPVIAHNFPDVYSLRSERRALVRMGVDPPATNLGSLGFIDASGDIEIPLGPFVLWDHATVGNETVLLSNNPIARVATVDPLGSFRVIHAEDSFTPGRRNLRGLLRGRPRCGRQYGPSRRGASDPSFANRSGGESRTAV